VQTALTLPLASYAMPNPQAGTQRLVNCYPEVMAPGNPKGPFRLIRAPGILGWADTGGGAIRGAVVHDGVLYVVSGTSVYSIDENGVQSAAFTGSVPGGERVRMETNGTNFVIVRPGDNTAYYNSAATTISQITDPVFTGWGASDVAFLDGYLIFLRPNSQNFFNSGLNALTFSALDIATAEGRPDLLNGLFVDHLEIMPLGVESCELWYDAANPTGSPFSRSPGALIEIGNAAPYSPEQADNSVFWLASDKSVRRLQGINPIRVSQHGVEAAIQRMAVISDAYGMRYSQEGHVFYVLTFPSAGRTFCYDANTKEWHERESLGYGYWRPSAIVEAYGMQLACDSQSGQIGILDPTTHEEWGDPQRARFTFAPAYNNGNLLTHHRLDLGVNVGDGLLTGQGENPLATLKVSNDGGRTYLTMPTKSLGLRGKYRTRVYWTKLGSAIDRVYSIEVTDPVPLFVLNAVLTYSGRAP
jgi:hypothetical protein